MYPAHHEDRILVKLDQVPTYLIDTLVAVEDRDFWNHHGVSLKSVARAVWVNTTAGQLRQGGSTLTQQLVKNFFLSNERSLSRKINEAMMAVLLELHYDKRDILESYLNEVFLGQDGQRAIHGFGLASQYFFSQPLAELKLDQVALLVGMVKGPSYFNPRRYPDRALARRNLVLDVLAEQGVATQQEVDAAKQRPLGVTRQGSMADSSYPAFLDLVKRQLRQDYRDEDLTEEGLRIFTSFDPILQEKAETSVNETLKRLSGRKGVDQVEAAMVVTNPETGEIQALIGSRDPRFAGFNRALDAVRPIGSLIAGGLPDRSRAAEQVHPDHLGAGRALRGERPGRPGLATAELRPALAWHDLPVPGPGKLLQPVHRQARPRRRCAQRAADRRPAGYQP